MKEGRGTKYWDDETIPKIIERRRLNGSKSFKLTEKQVIAILKSKLSQLELSKKYSVKISTISRIKSGIRWAYLKERFPELYG